MLTFNDLPVELQIEIWQLVLPHRGMHWVEIEGRPQEASYIRDSLRFTRYSCPDGKMPKTTLELMSLRVCAEHESRRQAEWQAGLPWFKPGHMAMGPFFRWLYTVTPSVWGQAGPEQDHGSEDPTERVDVNEEVAYTRRCRNLSTYTLVTTLLSTCSISRAVALRYIERQTGHPQWPIYRSKGHLFRPRPLDVWEAQCSGSNEPDYGDCHHVLVPRIRHTLDLVVLRLHDQHGRATPTLRRCLYQYSPETSLYDVMARHDRLAIEWHPRWAIPGPDGSENCHFDDVLAVLRLMDDTSPRGSFLYWLVDGIPRPDWKNDYQERIPRAFKACIEHHAWRALWKRREYTDDELAQLVGECDLDMVFEANGRRYYIVFVVINWKWYPLPESFMSVVDGPFIYGEAAWPESVRAPARFVYEAMTGMNERQVVPPLRLSYILSWEPI